MVLENEIKRRKKDKQPFVEALNEVLKSGKLPASYATIINYLRPEISKKRIYNVKTLGVIDWEVLNLMQELSKC